MITKNLNLVQSDKLANTAAKLFETWKDRSDEITPQQMFILGFLKGCDHAFEEMGLFDDSEKRDAAIYNFINNYIK